MVKRRKLGLMYEYNENWIGGTYYIQNLVLALNWLEDQKKPEIVVFCNAADQFEDLKLATGYPYLSNRQVVRSLNRVQVFANRVSNKIFRKLLFSTTYNDISLVFPGGFEDRFKKNQNFLYWIPDFQEHHLPDFFSENESLNRRNLHNHIVNNGKYLLLSSADAYNDFQTLYSSSNIQCFVVPFAVTHNRAYSTSDINEVRTKYNIPENFYLCSNQFWVHKNQITVLKAIKQLKARNVNIVVAFSGKPFDYRAPDYYESLLTYINSEGLRENVRLLGFIDRTEQLLLMKHAKAVIQPSLFEGWSTVVEDVKALNARLIVSNLTVHREQLLSYHAKVFFDPVNPASLVEALEQKTASEDNYNYQSDILRYANRFHDIFNTIISKHQV